MRHLANGGGIGIRLGQLHLGPEQIIERLDLFRISFSDGQNGMLDAQSKFFREQIFLPRLGDVPVVGRQVEITLVTDGSAGQQSLRCAELRFDLDTKLLFVVFCNSLDRRAHGGVQ